LLVDHLLLGRVDQEGAEAVDRREVEAVELLGQALHHLVGDVGRVADPPQPAVEPSRDHAVDLRIAVLKEDLPGILVAAAGAR